MADNNARPNTNRRRDLDGLRDAYISAVNSALETGRADLASELVAKYLDERRALVDAAQTSNAA
jgi:hypothetical protein